MYGWNMTSLAEYLLCSVRAQNIYCALCVHKGLEGSTGIAARILNLSIRRKMSSQLHAPAVIPRDNNLQIPLRLAPVAALMFWGIENVLQCRESIIGPSISWRSHCTCWTVMQLVLLLLLLLYIRHFSPISVALPPPLRKGLPADWRKMRNEELRWAWGTCRGKQKCLQTVVGNPKGRNRL